MSMSRREVLITAVMAALSGELGRGSDNANVQESGGERFVRFEELPPGAIGPRGWIRTYLEKQAQELTFSLPDVSWPFSERYWMGVEQAPSWWPWEQCAYWLDGSIRCALAIQDERLKQRAMERIRYTLDHCSGSYIGPGALRNGREGHHRWPHAILFRALAALSDSGDVPGIPQTLQKFYLSEPDGYDLPARNIVNVESMLWCYGKTGDRALLSLAETAWKKYLDGTPEVPADLTRAAVMRGGPINGHGVTYAEVAKLPVILYAHTGKSEYMEYALAAQKRIFDHHMLVDGAPSTSEYFRTTTSLDSHETCDITDHTWTWGYLLRVSGEGIWADRIERACFNAGMGSIKKDWKALQYFSSPNQVIATMTSNHNEFHKGNEWMAYQPNPGRVTACCAGNVHRFFPNYLLRMWMKTRNGDVAATLYGPSKVDVLAGAKRIPIGITQETSYPFEETIRFAIDAEKPAEFTFYLRIPFWCKRPMIEINGKRLANPVVERQFVAIQQEFRRGDKIVLKLPMEVIERQSDVDGVCYECGPLVYSLAVGADWTSSVIPKWSTEKFPVWSAVAKESWNYGVPRQQTPLLKRMECGADPWLSPPTFIEIDARKLNHWALGTPVVKDGTGVTPPLPSDRKGTGARERIRLVPYGATELRLTVFPRLA